MYVTQLISSTEWDNFLAQRYHKDAEPHIYKLAECVREVLSTNTPQNLKSGEWHVPYANTDLVIESIDGYLPEVQIEVDSLKSAAANCARLSYEVPGENKIATYEDNIRLFKRLAGSQPKHLSPLEHVAQCTINPKTSNFTGFTQLRKFYE
jgi:thymidylate synthase ThyX